MQTRNIALAYLRMKAEEPLKQKQPRENIEKAKYHEFIFFVHIAAVQSFYLPAQKKSKSKSSRIQRNGRHPTNEHENTGPMQIESNLYI